MRHGGNEKEKAESGRLTPASKVQSDRDISRTTNICVVDCEFWSIHQGWEFIGGAVKAGLLGSNETTVAGAFEGGGPLAAASAGAALSDRSEFDASVSGCGRGAGA